MIAMLNSTEEEKRVTRNVCMAAVADEPPLCLRVRNSCHILTSFSHMPTLIPFRFVRHIVYALACAATVLLPSTSHGQPAADSAAIRATALGYIEGWYTANAERMEQALHPDLAKRIINTNQRGRNVLGHQSAMTLVQNTRAGGGRETPVAEQRKDVRILDIFGNMASVRIDAGSWVDYLHVARWNGRWVIVNVLWEMRPQ
jgi:hypothetical protein